MEYSYLQIFRDKRELLEPFTLEEKGELLDAMMAYNFDGEEIELHTNARYIWPVFRKMIEQTKAVIESKSAARRGKATKGESEQNHSESEHNHSESKPNQDESQAYHSQSETNQNESDHNHSQSRTHQSESNGDIIQESRIKNQESRFNIQEREGDEVPPTPRKALKRFAPPTVEEVEAYCRERGNGLDAQHFVDFYASKGWKVGNQPMKDWRASVRTWEKRDRVLPDARGPTAPPPKRVQEQQYEQRAYDVSEFSGLSAAQMAELEAMEHGA